MAEPARHKGPIDHALDLFLYAPLGFVAEAPSLLPRFVKRGRDQVAMARAVGIYALRRDPEELQEVIEQHPDTKPTLKALGLLPPDRAVSGNGSQPAPAVEQVTGGDQAAPAAEAAAAPAAEEADAEVASVSSEPAIDPAGLAIPEYESLSASQVVPRLESLTQDELEAIRRYENQNRARRTILNKIAQLQAS